MPSSHRTSEPVARRPKDSLQRGRSTIYKLRALRDFTFGLSRARNLDESLRLALMVILGTFSLLKGVLFLEENGEFHARVSRGVPPGIPPVRKSKALLRILRRSRKPMAVRKKGTAAVVKQVVGEIESAVPALSVEFLCPLGTKKGILGILLLGPTLTGKKLTPRQRETLGVMTSFLSANLSNHRVVLEISSLNDVLGAQVKENKRLLATMQEIYLDTIRAFAAAIDAKDPYTRGHSERVARLSVTIARGLELPEQEVQAIHFASILHDVGKIVTDRTILDKSSSLTRAEKRELRKHPKRSYDILSKIRFPYPDVALLARHHHEWVDGSGYPDAKRDSQIPIGARIIAVADAFDAMMSNRPYRKSLPLTHAIAEVRDYVHQHFDPGVARVFFRILRKELNGVGGKVPFLPKEGNGFSRREVLRFLDGTLKGLS
ncbi:MAG TPA: HD-GYP domain-containing protein [Candidatus Deferrimicrobiaceae bacterium]|nr:HD-GYP domain-containing protein [Candidatus Deferrimicrobiaceae bacterium]